MLGFFMLCFFVVCFFCYAFLCYAFLCYVFFYLMLYVPLGSNIVLLIAIHLSFFQVLIPPKDLQNKLREASAMKAVLDEVQYRVEWEKLQEKKRKKEEEAKERERGKVTPTPPPSPTFFNMLAFSLQIFSCSGCNNIVSRN